MTDILANLGAARTKPTHRHTWTYSLDGGSFCVRCLAIKDEAKSRRGKTARQRGNAYEREIAHKLGIRRTGQYGGPDDVAGEHMVIQVKNGSVFPERLWGWLEQLPHDHRLRAVVVGDAPGPGKRRRELIVMDMSDYIAWYGGSNDND